MYMEEALNATKSRAMSLQNENVRFEQSRNVRFHRWPRAMETERIALSQRERDRLRVLHEIRQKQITQSEAARRLKISDRHQRHPGGQADWIAGVQPHDQSCYRGGQARCKHDAIGRHSRLRQNLRVHHDDVRHVIKVVPPPSSSCFIEVFLTARKLFAEP
jgi:hypothetical protein